jgi:HEPN domain-containing protein
VSFVFRERLERIIIKRTGEFPTKSHSLIYFVDKTGLELNEAYYEFIYTLNNISVPTRYPDDLKKLFTVYTKERTESILQQTKEVQLWIKQQ